MTMSISIVSRVSYESFTGECGVQAKRGTLSLNRLGTCPQPLVVHEPYDATPDAKANVKIENDPVTHCRIPTGFVKSTNWRDTVVRWQSEISIHQELKCGWVIFGSCSVCRIRFKPKNSTGSSRQIHSELTATFNSHNCKPGARRAAARIVREATHDH